MFRRMKHIAVLLAVLCFACQGPQQTPASHAERSLRILTYNIHHGAGIDGKLDLERIAGVLSRSGADLIALQEVDRNVKRTDQVDQLQVLARLTGMHSAFAKFMNYGGGEYGLAILSRYPMMNTRTIHLPPGKAEPRSALAVRVEHPDLGPITFVCLHLDWLDNDTERYAQAQALMATLDDVGDTVILAGDFNDQPGSRTIRLMKQSFTDASKPEHAPWTFPSPKPEREIDFVMYRSAHRIRGFSHVLDEHVASDHRPVLAELRPIHSPAPPITPPAPTPIR